MEGDLGIFDVLKLHMGCQRHAMSLSYIMSVWVTDGWWLTVADANFGTNSVIKLFKIDKKTPTAAKMFSLEIINSKSTSQIELTSASSKKFQNPPRDFSYANITQKYLSSHHKFNFVSLL